MPDPIRNKTQPPVGRFAPSPTGPLHFGSLVAALGSYLNVKSKGGSWLLRIENLDPPREDPQAPDAIFRSLEAHGLLWDGRVRFQATRHETYLEALETLINLDRAYPCSCTRGIIRQAGKMGPFGPIYPGSCRKFPLNPDSVFYSWRVVTDDQLIEFEDQRAGLYRQRLESEVGDFIVKRSDGFYAYQLAVVVDDADQGVTEVVRGEDLLCNTPRQIYLQRLLGLPTPEYLHLPIARDAEGRKLSKQNHAPAIDNKQASRNLVEALTFLGHPPPASLRGASPDELLRWGLENWNIQNIGPANGPVLEIASPAP
ncbi:MAG TPA: tRNA glutamyl-Q(34) synthetase GluQRS [Gammaproteobacteria bacterium]|nr:tRNA glutamyl-Q(34) synthetase GluQRS [Gammaproteobacteria bacterium]